MPNARWSFPLSPTLALALSLSACSIPVRATPDGRGGWKMQTTAESVDQAMQRFQEEAPRLCPGGSYAFGDPVKSGAARPMQVAIDFRCTGP